VDTLTFRLNCLMAVKAASQPSDRLVSSAAGLRIAYLVNQYPMVSLSFIRREIHALESIGVEVRRFSIREWNDTLVDPLDQREKAKTRYILRSRPGSFVLSAFAMLLTRPVHLLWALRLAIRTGWRSDRGLMVNLVYLLEAFVLFWWCRRANIQHVHAHFGSNPAAVAMLCRELGGPPYSFTVHGPEEFDRAKALALGHKISRAKFVVAVSDFGRSQLFRWCSHDQWPKIHVIRCGLDGAFLDSTPCPLPREPRLACVGRLCEQKGQLLLLEAAKRLASEAVDFELAFVGDGEMRPQIERRIAELGLSSSVRITGWVASSQVRREMLASRALCVPSFAEGLPVVIMESLALGRPVISTYVAGIPELVKPGVSGWLVPAGSINALAMAMREALEAPVEQLQCMGEKGAKQVSALHDANAETVKLSALFQDGFIPPDIRHLRDSVDGHPSAGDSGRGACSGCRALGRVLGRYCAGSARRRQT